MFIYFPESGQVASSAVQASREPSPATHPQQCDQCKGHEPAAETLVLLRGMVVSLCERLHAPLHETESQSREADQQDSSDDCWVISDNVVLDLPIIHTNIALRRKRSGL